MEIRKLINSEYADASSLIQNVMKAEGKGSWSEQGAASVLSFLNDRLPDFIILGLFDSQLKAVLVYEEDPCHIIFLGVMPQETRNGYGSRLLSYFLDKEDQKNEPRVVVNAAESAVGFYQRMGFETLDQPTEAEGLRYQPMEYLLGRHLLGKKAVVTIDHPLGSPHPYIPDEIYMLNTGYISQPCDVDGRLIEAYVIGTDEPVDSFQGYVIAMIYRKDGEAIAVVGPAGIHVSKEEIINAVAFQEQYYDTRIIMADQEK